MKKIMYKWVLMNQYGDMVNYGVRDSSIEMDVEIHRGIDSSADRNMCEMQDYLDTNYKHLELSFHYKEVEIDFTECTK